MNRVSEKTARNRNMLKKKTKLAFHGRFLFVQIVFLAVALLIGYKIFDLQILNQHFYQNESDKRSVRYETLPAHRGVVFDRNGKILAVSAPVATVWANPQVLVEVPGRWQALADALGVKERWLAQKVKANASKEFIYLKRQMTPEEAARVTALGVPGVDTIDEQKRYYPMGEVTAHLIGITGIDNKGQEGLELGFDRWLTGTEGSRRVVRDRRGRLVRAAELIKSAEPGKEIMLSIDSGLQYMAYRELKKAVAENKAQGGSLVMIDVHTGEVLAMVNQPSYNPNNRAELKAFKMRNRALTDTYEPGSTLKPFTIAAALETGNYHSRSLVNTGNGYLRVGRKDLYDKFGYGLIDVETVLKKSSNIGMTKIALDIGPDKVIDVMQKIGLGQAPGTGFPGERTGVLPYRDRWSDIEIATLSFGYGLTVTPMQLAQAYAIFGAGGIMRPVSLIRRDVAPEGRRVMSEDAVNEVLRMMSTIVRPGGTGRLGAVESYNVAGKTGTAQKVGSKGYDKDRHVGLFAGVAPVENPRIATVVIIDDPRGDKYYGGLTAAPVFSSVNAQALRMLGVKPPDEQVLTAKNTALTSTLVN